MAPGRRSLREPVEPLCTSWLPPQRLLCLELFGFLHGHTQRNLRGRLSRSFRVSLSAGQEARALARDALTLCHASPSNCSTADINSGIWSRKDTARSSWRLACPASYRHRQRATCNAPWRSPPRSVAAWSRAASRQRNDQLPGSPSSPVVQPGHVNPVLLGFSGQCLCLWQTLAPSQVKLQKCSVQRDHASLISLRAASTRLHQGSLNAFQCLPSLLNLLKHLLPFVQEHPSRLPYAFRRSAIMPSNFSA